MIDQKITFFLDKRFSTPCKYQLQGVQESRLILPDEAEKTEEEHKIQKKILKAKKKGKWKKGKNDKKKEEKMKINEKGYEK